MIRFENICHFILALESNIDAREWLFRFNARFKQSLKINYDELIIICRIL